MNGSVPPRQLGGGYGGRGRGGWGQPRSVATGANDTPLGTPTRSSPLPTPVTALQPALKGSDDAVKAPPTVEVPRAQDLSEKKKKEQKRKSIAADEQEVGVRCMNHVNCANSSR
jgi:cell growth-regulating nucleolar protein